MSRSINRRSFLASTAGLSAVLFCGIARASSSDIIRIEQDWSIEIGDPDPDTTSPQIVTVFGPQNPITGLHAMFEINHSTMPDFTAGGMQLQAWSGNSLVGYKSQFAPAAFNTAGEIVTFTTATEVQTDGRIRMEVINGVSDTWGTFDGERALRIRLYSWIDDLNNWDLQNPIRYSRVCYGANRVTEYKRTAIRYFNRTELDHETVQDTIVEAWDT